MTAIENNTDQKLNVDIVQDEADQVVEHSETSEKSENSEENVKKWYAIQAYSGSELSVKIALEKLVRDFRLEDKVGQILVPTESLIEVKKGKQKTVDKPLYSGYVFAELDLDTALWHRIQSLSKVSRFIGEAKSPTPLNDKDIQTILDKVANKPKPKPKISFEVSETVRIKEGPFANFSGVVEEYDMITGRLKLTVSIFGRSAPVDILYSQVEKII